MIPRVLLAGLIVVAAARVTDAAPITVPATSDIWLAGMPDGSTASFEDVAPGQSPVLVPMTIFSGAIVRFTLVTGLTDHCDAVTDCGFAPAEGDFTEALAAHATGAENGIGNIGAPVDSLIGVFLGPDQPSLTAAPGPLVFFTPASRDFLTLAPLLKQPFFIGDGRRDDGVTLQSFIAPAGATRLFLGTMDGFGWWNNRGELIVTVPEPMSMTLLGLGLGAAAFARRRRR